MGPKKKNVAKYKHAGKNKAPEVERRIVKTDTKPQVKTEIQNDDNKSSSDIKTSDVKPMDPKYRKRTIESNWKKYEIEEEASTYSEAIIFNEEILKSNYHGGIGSQFRFSDEKEWEDLTEDSISEFHTLDMRDLALSLACIPLNQRLDIDNSYFELEALSRMETEANNMKLAYSNKKLPPIVNKSNRDQTLYQNKRGDNSAHDLSCASSKNEFHVQRQIEPPTKAELPDETELEFKLDALLNLRTATSNTNSDDVDLPVVCLDDIN